MADPRNKQARKKDAVGRGAHTAWQVAIATWLVVHAAKELGLNQGGINETFIIGVVAAALGTAASMAKTIISTWLRKRGYQQALDELGWTDDNGDYQEVAAGQAGTLPPGAAEAITDGRP